MSSNEIITHHEFSPSKLERFEECPYSYIISKGYDSGNADSTRGTLLHQAVYDDAVFATLSGADKRTVAEIREKHTKPYANYEHYNELYVDICDENGNKISGGIIDYLVISPDGKTASIKDWKFGGSPVTSAEFNRQMWGYSTGVFQRFESVETVFALIVQPAYGSEEYDRQAEFTRAEHLPIFIGKIKEIINACKTATETSAVPSASACRYCNKLACPVYKRKMEENMQMMGIDKSQLKESDIAMTVEYADRLLCAKRDIENLLELKTELAKQTILANGGSANFTVCSGRKTRKTDWQQLVKDLNVDEETICRYTTEKVGEQYLQAINRKPRLSK